jgi:hypothetical protein
MYRFRQYILGILMFGPILTEQCFASDSANSSNQAASGKNDLEEAVAIGVTAGLLSGVGFSYREFDREGDGHHVGGIFFGDKSDVFVSVGYERLNRISRYDQSALYWYWGGSLYYTYWDSYDCTPVEEKPEEGAANAAVTCKEEPEHTYRFSAGPGLSFEYGMNKGLSVALELPLALSYDWTPPRSTSGLSIFPVPSIVVQYRL